MGIIEPRSTVATFLHCLHYKSYHTGWDLSGLLGEGSTIPKDFVSDLQIVLLIQSSGISSFTPVLTCNLSPSAVCPLFHQEINEAPSIIEIQIIYPLRKQCNKSQFLYSPSAQSLFSGAEYKTAYTIVFDVRNFILYSSPNSPRFDFLDPYVLETCSFTPRASREQEYCFSKYYALGDRGPSIYEGLKQCLLEWNGWK